MNPSRTPGRTLPALIALALLAASALARPAAANLLTNGSFDAAPDPGATTVMLAPGATMLAPWEVTTGSVECVGSAYWAPMDGGCSVALNGATNGGVAQSFSTVPGGLYGVSFALAGDPSSSPALKHVRLSAAGTSIDYTFDTSAAWNWAMGWTTKTWSFNAVASTTTLEFTSQDAAATTGPAIDRVDVTLTSLVGVGAGPPVLALAPAAPNPTRGAARIEWLLPRSGMARLAIHDVRGRTIAVLADGEQAAGPHSATWDASGAAAGVYLVSLETAGQVRTSRVAVLH